MSPHSVTQEIFQKAVRAGDCVELQRLLQRWCCVTSNGAPSGDEVNVNFFDGEGMTALHQSCMDGNLELVKLLVKFGADVRLANRDGWSALHIAAYGGHQDIALYLIANSSNSSSNRRRTMTNSAAAPPTISC